MIFRGLLVSILFYSGLNSLAFAGSEPALPAASTLTLDQAITEAKTKSPELGQAQAASEKAHWKTQEVFGTGFLPRLSLTGLYYFDKKFVYTDIPLNGAAFSFPNIFPTSQLAIDASLPLFDGFSSSNQLRASALNEDASRNDLARTGFQLEQDIRLAFYQALAAALLDEVTEQNVKTLEDHLNQSQILRKGGAATNYDVLRVEVQLSEAKSDALDAKDNVTLTRKKLNQLLGVEQDDRPLVGELPAPQEAEQVRDLKITSTPIDRTDLRALELKSEAASRASTAQSAWLVPTVSITAQYFFYNNLTNSLANTSDYRSAYNVGLLVKWNLFDGGASFFRSRQAVYEGIQAEKVSQKARLAVPFEFDLWKRRYLSNASRYRSKLLDVQRSKESVRLAREGERAGTRTSTEVLDAELDLFRAKAGVVNALNNSAEAQVRLELALGRKI